jgi:hypothetical protein
VTILQGKITDIVIVQVQHQKQIRIRAPIIHTTIDNQKVTITIRQIVRVQEIIAIPVINHPTQGVRVVHAAHHQDLPVAAEDNIEF